MTGEPTSDVQSHGANRVDRGPQLLRYAGVAYILWLAIRSLRSALRAGAPPPARPVQGGELRTFLGGALLHLTNPKAVVSWGAVYAVAVPPGSGPVELASIWALLITASATVFFGYALLFSAAAAMERYLRLRRWIEGAFGLLFGGAALALATARPA
ncbi:MAG: LysE family translocator [Pseudomonadota bacterium]